MEVWDGYLQDGSLAQKDLVRGEPIPPGLYHLVCEVLVRHTDGSYLLMQRDSNKHMYGGFWEATAGGSALKGENAITCARRELLEETGISAMTLEQVGQTTSHNTIYSNFLCITDCEKTAILLQPGETVAYQWVCEQDFISFIHTSAGIPTQKAHYTDYFKRKGYL